MSKLKQTKYIARHGLPKVVSFALSNHRVYGKPDQMYERHRRISAYQNVFERFLETLILNMDYLDLPREAKQVYEKIQEASNFDWTNYKIFKNFCEDFQRTYQPIFLKTSLKP